MRSILVVKVNSYLSHYCRVGDILSIYGVTVHGLPFVLSKHKNNKGHKVVFNSEYFEWV